MAEIQAPQIFSNFLAGRQARQAEQQQAAENQFAQQRMQMQQAEFDQQRQQMAQQQQFNQLAAQYLGPQDVQMAGGLPSAPQQQRPDFSQLVALDPQRAFAIQNAVRAQQEQAQAQRQAQAQQGALSAQYVMQSKSPARLIREGFPDIAKDLEQNGVDVASMTDDEARDIAQRYFEKLAPIAGLAPSSGGDEFTLSEGQTRFDASGNPIASVAKQPSAEDANQGFTRANTLRDEFNNLTKDYSTVQQAYDTINSVAAQPSAAGDLSLVFAYMKMLDPNSSVRESEQASASNAAGVPSRIRNQWNKLLNGETLNPEQRQDFVGQAANVLKARRTQYDKTRGKYKTLASRAGVDPIDVIGEEDAPPPSDASAPMSFATEAEAEAAGIKPGTRVVIGGVSGTWN